MRLEPATLRGLCRARVLLRSLDEEAPSVEEVAREVGLSTSHFIRVFAAAFGVTPHQLRTRARIERARRLLEGGRLTVTEVCMEVGFSSLGSFSSLFKRRVGRLPSEVRRRGRVVVQVPWELPAAPIPGCVGMLTRLAPGALRDFGEA